MMIEERRPYFSTVRDRANVTRLELARAAQMTIQEVMHLERTCKGTEADIKKLVEGLNKVLRTEYDVDHFRFTSTDMQETQATERIPNGNHPTS
jgi:translation initiation factor 2 beta subunit (eIF-2beta)/eIF-5